MSKQPRSRSNPAAPAAAANIEAQPDIPHVDRFVSEEPDCVGYIALAKFLLAELGRSDEKVSGPLISAMAKVTPNDITYLYRAAGRELRDREFNLHQKNNQSKIAQESAIRNQIRADMVDRTEAISSSITSYHMEMVEQFRRQADKLDARFSMLDANVKNNTGLIRGIGVAVFAAIAITILSAVIPFLISLFIE